MTRDRTRGHFWLSRSVTRLSRSILDDNRNAISDLHGFIFTLILYPRFIRDCNVLTYPAVFIEDRPRIVVPLPMPIGTRPGK